MNDITDDQIAAAVRPLYTDDAAASMGLADDIRTARAVLALRPSASASPGQEQTPMVHNCCGREVCNGKDCPNGGPWYKVPKWRMDAYYYGFEPTGVASIDRILSAVACAGKAYHHTEEWREDAGTKDHLRGTTPVEWIQNAANDAASPPPPTEETAEADRASEVKFEIETQGAPVVNHAWRENSETAVVLIDMRSKYCEVSWYGNDHEEVPSIGISASDRSLHLDETKDRDDSTGLRFPEFKGWRIIATDLGRYTLTVVFARRAQEEET